MHDKLYTAPSRIAGTGCFAAVPIQKGELLGEYVGELIDDDEADKRYADKQGLTYLFWVDENKSIDALHVEHPVKYINHCCEPNCEAQQDGDRIFIHAKKDIAKDEEVFYDYELVLDDGDEEFYGCLCGSESCRKTMAAKKN